MNINTLTSVLRRVTPAAKKSTDHCPTEMTP